MVPSRSPRSSPPGATPWQPGLVVQLDGITVAVVAFAVASDRITHVWVVRNPEKLRPWTTR